MYLNVNDARLVDEPSRREVADSLQALEFDEYIILSRADEEYIQTYLNDDGTYQLEYRDGDDERHFAVDPDAVTLDDVCRAFDVYCNGGDVAPLLDWQKVEVSPAEPGEGEVEYNGVVMDADWPEQIEAAQQITTIDLEGATYDRIRFGAEVGMPTAQLQNCGDCGVLQGQYHVPGCEIEQCPRCQGQVASCACNADDE